MGVRYCIEGKYFNTVTNKPAVRMKRILVTGANKGIGLAIVTKLLQDFPDTHLLLGSRDLGRGQKALQQVLDQVGDAEKDRVELIQLDVTSDESVNNAVGFSESARGTVDLNTYGLRRVCEAFLPLIQKDKGRIVQVSSGAAPMFVRTCNQEIQDFFV